MSERWLRLRPLSEEQVRVETELGLALEWQLGPCDFVFLTPCCSTRYKHAQLRYRRCTGCRSVTKLEQANALIYNPFWNDPLGTQTRFLQRRVPQDSPKDGRALQGWLDSALDPLEAVLTGAALLPELVRLGQWRDTVRQLGGAPAAQLARLCEFEGQF